MRKLLLLITDTTSHQINGVTRCIDELLNRLDDDIDVKIVSADDFMSIPFPGYKEIRLSLSFPHSLKKHIFALAPDYIHIETEGPVGISAARICRKYHIPYTTTFHTKFPEYLNMRTRLFHKDLVHWYLHYVHNGAERIFVSNAGLMPYLEENEYGSTVLVPLGINHALFFPGEKTLFLESKKPVLLFVGRIAVEKNIRAFLSISDRYEKVIVGDGPDREKLEAEFPEAHFLGVKKGTDLAEVYRSADVFVFPSKTDTLGLVNLEAMACGKSVVAYDLDTMRGIITHGDNGILVPESASLEDGIPEALKLTPEASIKKAKQYSWEIYYTEFMRHQALITKKLWTSLNTSLPNS